MKNSEFDQCVMCGKKTDYEKLIPISNRQYYVEGAGQLCSTCYIKIYGYVLDTSRTYIHF